MEQIHLVRLFFCAELVPVLAFPTIYMSAPFSLMFTASAVRKGIAARLTHYAAVFLSA
jgi:hypothetical protein